MSRLRANRYTRPDANQVIGVSEHFYSIQGEGPHSGRPAVFLRTKGCKLDCAFCDTTAVWKQGTVTPVAELITRFNALGYTRELKAGAMLILTGGSPLIHQVALTSFLKLLRREVGGGIWTAVETEGIIHPTPAFSLQITNWVVSPKLASSLEPASKRIIPETLKSHAHMATYSPNSVAFKFPVKDMQDLIEAKTLIREFNIPRYAVWLMPIASTREELAKVSAAVADMCKENCFNFSSRLQLQIWDKATGV